MKEMQFKDPWREPWLQSFDEDLESWSLEKNQQSITSFNSLRAGAEILNFVAQLSST